MRQRVLLSLNKNLLPALIGVLSIFSIPQLSAASQLSRGWVYINLNKPDCVSRARAAASVERLPNLQITENYIFWTSPGILGTVHCLTVDSARTIAFIVVSETTSSGRGQRTEALPVKLYKMELPRDSL